VIVNLYKHRGYIWRTAYAELRHRYAGAGLGAVWNILQPLAMILIFTVIFTQVFKRSAGDAAKVAYPVYLCSALLPWSAFAECINRGTQSFVSHAIYLRKLPIPEQVFVAQSALGTAMNLSISFLVLIGLSIALDHPPTCHWVLVPIPLLFLLALAFGLGLALGTLNAFIRDVGQAIPILMQIGFWTYPIVYPAEVLPEAAQTAIRFNPIYPSMESVRALFIDGRLPPAWMWLAMAGWSAAACAAGYLVLRRLRPELRDVI
jgi:lipopolysaccharide transport system permease protein